MYPIFMLVKHNEVAYDKECNTVVNYGQILIDLLMRRFFEIDEIY